MSGFDHEAILAALPQQEPFRFVDRILEVDEDHIVATFRFRPEKLKGRRSYIIQF